MDPLSILASSITLTTVVLKTADLLQQILSNCQELNDLIDEVDKLGSIFEEAQDVFSERKKHAELPQQAVEAGSRVVCQAQIQLNQLNKLLARCLRHSKERKGCSKLAYVLWLRSKRESKNIQQNLMSARLSLCTLWGVVAMSDNTSIQLSLQEMAYLNQSQLSQMSDHMQVLQSIAQQVCKPEKPEITSEEVEEVVTDTGMTSQYIQEVNIARHMKVQESTALVRKRYPRYRQTPCEGWCSCRCHRASKIQTPQKFALVIGRLLISYSGFQIRPQKCSERACRRQSIPTVKVMYQFPTWLLQRMLYFAASISEMNGPEFTFSIPRTVSPNAIIFSYAVQGNMERIQELFTRGLASPYDVASNNGRTALHVSQFSKKHLGFSNIHSMRPYITIANLHSSYWTPGLIRRFRTKMTSNICPIVQTPSRIPLTRVLGARYPLYGREFSVISSIISRKSMLGDAYLTVRSI
ncbi:hypothetical protein K432DRAFT_363613 [Lepidopterella palustris CBS 459.81]|uniref:Fungal N-terminal domain-containing protein n=1 Tax=Lepidopterella palustris CBS 459.81 TaxID=1314670 RepID=A0A8E2J9H8_9PEZI|nr:hypothetical protein K432DRAFT_363613 [Lepidopterella palustris CBS 459.81]